MSKNYYISDLHFRHRNALAFDNRPWHNIEDMERDVISNWNNVVDKSDNVYVLGDFVWSKKEEDWIEILNKLNGNIHLVLGNHDIKPKKMSQKLRDKFASISEYKEINDNGRNVVLCHYPIPCFKNHFYFWYHLYGHTHTGFESNMMENIKRQMKDLYAKPCEMYNVGCMLSYMNYTPRTLDEIIEGYRKGEIK